MKRFSFNRRPDMFYEAAENGRGKNIFLEILIFVGVFIVTSSVSSIPSTIYMMLAMFENMPDISGMTSALSSGDTVRFADAMEDYMEALREFFCLKEPIEPTSRLVLGSNKKH